MRGAARQGGLAHAATRIDVIAEPADPPTHLSINIFFSCFA
jgi:hypothetical protein